MNTHGSPKAPALCPRELHKSSSKTPRPRSTLCPSSGAGTAASSSTGSDQHRGHHHSPLHLPETAADLGPAKTDQGPGREEGRLPRNEGSGMTHLRKGLAAAEAVNLHLVEAGDLHGGAEAGRPPSQSLSPRGTRAAASQAPAARGSALADDALPGRDRAGSRKTQSEGRERPGGDGVGVPRGGGAGEDRGSGGPGTALPPLAVPGVRKPLGSLLRPKCRSPRGGGGSGGVGWADPKLCAFGGGDPANEFREKVYFFFSAVG